MANLASVSKTRKFSSRNSSLGDKIFDIIIYVVLTLLMVVTLYPFINTLAVSLNAAADSMKGGIHLLPRQFSLENYKFVFNENTVYNATLISVLRSVIGTIVTVFASAMVAYTISRPEYVLRKFVTIAFIITMYINGGLIPNFLLIRDLGLLDTFAVYILPGIIGVFNLIIIRSFIEQLPDSILESARIDGAGDFRTFVNIVLPLCLPVLATVALFSTVSQWNSWFDVFLYNSSNEHLSTLQYELQKILQNSNTTSSAESGFANSGAGDSMKVSPLSIRATMTIVASVPMIIIYPFLQKYFVKGMTVGGVKG
ncbi:carbohydrate ABC transporter permease [Paenibacillus sp. PR3]|uniref:Carbohydrate ABC transporter permease n=1 Tax=Paenibacillus terricola TaxID=2763503 RepID=A0ABR8N0Q3_9BACL|nr:carbohydrate ABC transporter permease [Paenibacillus terricola]MBD3921778.1 carbohydrate ABC transporter permease [Paenibacillus terricola]